MRNLTRDQLEARREELLRKLHGLPNLMRGIVYEKDRKCGRASCVCAGKGPKHRTRQLSVTLGGKTRHRYIRVGDMERVEGMVETYHDLVRIVEELTVVNLELLRGSHPPGRVRHPRLEAR